MISGVGYFRGTFGTGAFGITGPTGEKGDTGFTGIGDTGYTGYTGYTGPIGLPGTASNTGATGYTGYTGFTGYTGPIGPEGFASNTGATGPQGIQGDTGYTGYTGFTGMTGPVGWTGYTGETGPQGIQGDTGDTGYTGYTGPQGIQGDTGYTGATGEGSYTGTTREVEVIGNQIGLPDIVHIGDTDNYGSTGVDGALLIVGDVTVGGGADAKAESIITGSGNILGGVVRSVTVGNNVIDVDSDINDCILLGSNLVNGSALIRKSFLSGGGTFTPNFFTGGSYTTAFIHANACTISTAIVEESALFLLTGGEVYGNASFSFVAGRDFLGDTGSALNWNIILGNEITKESNSQNLIFGNRINDQSTTNSRDSVIIGGGGQSAPSRYHDASDATRTFINDTNLPTGYNVVIAPGANVHISSGVGSETRFFNTRPVCSEVDYPTTLDDDLTSKSYVDARRQQVLTYLCDDNLVSKGDTFTAPAGVDGVWVTAWGGGGGGGRREFEDTTGGGAGGAMVDYYMKIEPGESFGLTIGAGGVGRTVDGAGGNGFPTIIDGSTNTYPYILYCGCGGGGDDGLIEGAGGSVNFNSSANANLAVPGTGNVRLAQYYNGAAGIGLPGADNAGDAYAWGTFNGGASGGRQGVASGNWFGRSSGGTSNVGGGGGAGGYNGNGGNAGNLTAAGSGALGSGAGGGGCRAGIGNPFSSGDGGSGGVIIRYFLS